MSVYGLLKFIVRHPLNRGHPAKALTRFAKWQIASRLSPGDFLIDWIEGSRLIVRKGETGLTQNIYTGLQEFPDMAYVLHTLAPDELFVDVGANSGSYTVLACAVRGAMGIAFEPVPSTYGRLMENIHVNHLSERVKGLNVGLGREPGRLAFTSDRDTMNRVVALGEEVACKIEVEITTLDVALQNQLPSLMKIDVEGFETAVLDGATETLGKSSLHSIIMELNGSGNRFGFDEGKILGRLRDQGFKPFSYEPYARRLIPLQSKNLDAGNTLFVRNLDLVRERLNQAPKMNVLGNSF